MVTLIKDRNIHKANEILYILNALDEVGKSTVSKVGIQKIYYLSSLLSPIKNIVMSIIRFYSQLRGPYNYEIQNTIDQLVAYGLIDVCAFQTLNYNAALSEYRINLEGKKVVNSLIKYYKEEEKNWWINFITKCTFLYSRENLYDKNMDYQGFDTIVNLVYKDSTYEVIKKNSKKNYPIDIDNKNLPTNELINYVKNYVEVNKKNLNFGSERQTAEIIILTYFEFLYTKFIEAKNNE
ncbi:hypothetical protein AAEO57_09830 [Flavobacterium sp. DGU38]|uniref:Uncharacterized protein n=1 Tax=Flavobacterium calami TaxID=3139144 RepID=A0ABU9INQ8_9FLAO